jgi:putative transposase
LSGTRYASFNAVYGKGELMFQDWISALAVLFFQAWIPRRDAQIRLLKLQVQLLRQKLPGNRVILSPADRLQLMRIGEQLDHQVDDLIEIVNVKTYRRWLRERAAGQPPGQVGRFRLGKWARQLVLRLAKENSGWGVRRVIGELKKLGVIVSRSSARRILVAEGLLPDPDRHAPKGVVTPWRMFISMHLNTMVATDFFCKTVWTPLGKKLAFGLVFIHLDTRKVFLCPSTYHPTGQWVQQQARNVTMWLEDQGIEACFLIHDNDTKFSEAFDEHFRRVGCEVVRTPFQSPIANSFAESWIANMKRECLNHFFCFSLSHLDYIGQIYADYYNTVRPHQSMGNEPLIRHGPLKASLPPPAGMVRRQRLLGGLLNHYYRKAA